MTTLKAPTITQWQKLCEMAGLKVLDECPYPYIDDFSKNRPFYIDYLPHNTDALMRLMGELCERYTHTFDTGRATITALLRSNLMAITSAGIDIDPGRAFRLAACDILAQLAEAEGIQ